MQKQRMKPGPKPKVELLGPELPKKVITTCRAKGDGWACDKRGNRHGYCSAHYHQRQAGEVRPIRKQNKRD